MALLNQSLILWLPCNVMKQKSFVLMKKRTFFGCSLDGEAAFEVVDRTILLRELYCSGEKGEYWMANKFGYGNTKSQKKNEGKAI